MPIKSDSAKANSKSDQKELETKPALPTIPETIKATLKTIQSHFGPEAIMVLNDQDQGLMDIDVIPTGSLLLNHILGIKGYPRGRIIEIFGPDGSGKTTLALLALAQTQLQGQIGAFIDAEHALDLHLAQRLGVNLNQLIFAQPDSGEQALAILEALIKSEKIALVVVDSVAALVPEVELSGAMNDQTIGAQARLMSKALRKLAGIIATTKTTVIFINQVRQNISNIGYGPKETTAGGRALRFYASLRLDLRRIETIKANNEPIGYKTKIKVAKNKLAPPFKTTIISVDFNRGINQDQELLALAVEAGIINQAGSWYQYEDQKLGQGQIKAAEYLKAHPALKATLLRLITKPVKSD